MRAALIVAILIFFAALGLFCLTIPGDIEKFGILGAARTSLYLGLLAGSWVYAWLRGGGPERIVASILVADVPLDPLLHLFLTPRFTAVDPTHLILGVGYLAAFLAVALRAGRLWTLWLCAFHGLSVLSHVTRALDVNIHPVTYAIMQTAWSYLILLILNVGTWNHQRLLRTTLAGASWSNSSVPPAAAPPNG